MRFNNVLRIARDRGVLLTDLTVVADGDFNAEGTASTGIDCSIELGGEANRSDLISVAEAFPAGHTIWRYPESDREPTSDIGAR